MKAFQAYNKRTGKYLHEMPELFGGWNRKKGPKKFYTRAADARGALSNVLVDLPGERTEWNPDEWEIHELAFRIVGKEPFRKGK